ncbi:putative integral membrane protein [Streptomyces sp. W007]|uniref:SCO6880 family protein n=1 Tax=Streptomyces sp. W007 TaxID=1055352 RepID=UPI000241A49C|nr:SCO6880 family protein [Streptomyces sp. W007]EHM26036.1 putative integral membrane protein [Streptomyces sp. W007]
MTVHEVPNTLRVEGFRTRRSYGFLSLSQQATFIACGVLLAEAFIALYEPLTLVVTMPVTFAVVGLTASRRHGMPALSYYRAVVAWKLAARSETTSYRAVLLPHPYALDLPGVAASSTLIKAHDPTTGRDVGVVHNRATGCMTVSTLLAPGGSLMAPTGTVRGNLRTWASVLDAMSTEDQILGASVTIQITPGAGEALGDDIKARRDPHAPALARSVVSELVRTAPHATASVSPWMSVTVDPSATATASLDLGEQVAETLRIVDALDLSGTGTDIIRRATDVDLRRLVRAAYDPDSFHARDEEIRELSWGECGPQAADDHFEEYAHDGAISVSWVLRAMPNRPIPYSTLLPLVSPGRFQRRVTLAYRVLDPREGERVLEREINSAANRAKATAQVKGRARWSQKADYAKAEKAAAQAAGGAQVVDWTLMVTVTARSAEELPAARQEVERAIKKTRSIRMRPAYGAEAAVFAAGLPVGYNPLVK